MLKSNEAAALNELTIELLQLLSLISKCNYCLAAKLTIFIINSVAGLVKMQCLI